VTGDPIDKRFETYYKGRHIYFSSADCVAKFDASPAVYLKKLGYQGETGDREFNRTFDALPLKELRT